MLEPTLTFDPGQATALWDYVGERLDHFLTAWQAGPPQLADFLPSGPPHVRELLLTEIIKADLELGWKSGQRRRKLEDYLAEFPELSRGAGVSAGLILEEFHVRKQHGDAITPQDCFERFPNRARELADLMGVATSELTTSLLHRGRVAEIDVDEAIDDFDLLALLGRGSFAKVFLARQRSMQRLVALKISADRGAEPQTMARLDHPNIVRVFDQRQLPERGIRLLYMQYVAGVTLREAVVRAAGTPAAARDGKVLLQTLDQGLRERGEEPPYETLFRRQLSTATWSQMVCLIGSRLADALAYAHNQNVLHRDLKPANILLAADGNPKLVDFNVSYAKDTEGATAAAYFGGSLAYMSPEQLQACNPAQATSPQDLDARSDLYSLGIVLWELYTGKRPFADDGLSGDWTAILERMTSVRAAGCQLKDFPIQHDPIGTSLEKILLRCTQFKAEERHATAGELARDLRMCLHPHALRLITAARERQSLLGRWPLLSLVAAGVLPHVPMSIINIEYNRREIVDVLKIPRTQFMTAVGIINAILYPLGAVLIGCFALPVARAARNRTQPQGRDRWVMRLVTLGDGFAYVSLSIWVVCGCLFATWLKIRPHDGVTPQLRDLAQFFFSHLLCGLIASTFSFVAIHWLCVRYFLPECAGQISAETARNVANVKRRVWWFLVAAFAVPFLALLSLVLSSRPDNSGISVYFGWLGGLGLVNTLVIFWATMTIHADLDALLPVLVHASEDPEWNR